MVGRRVWGACVASSALSAALLFTLQLLVSKSVLPAFGGAPAVWNTCLCFFQVTLVAGYAFAHGLRAWAPSRVQVVVHAGLVAAGLALMPRVLGTSAADGGVLALLAVLVAAAGVPLLGLSTTSPLVQGWFSDAGHRDPYALYAASNAGSLVALLAYPFIVQPLSGLDQQAFAITVGMGLLVALVGLAWPGRRSEAVEPAPVSAPAPWSRLRWLLLAFVPASLLHGVTTLITTDIAAGPLLWALPLALYLGSYVIAFASRPLLSYGHLQAWLPVLMAPAIVLSLTSGIPSDTTVLAGHVMAFFLVACALHRALRDLAPPASRLTEFYLFIAVGGALGGAFNALLAPLVFSSVREYALVLIVAAVVLEGVRPKSASSRPMAFAVGVLAVAAVIGFRPAAIDGQIGGLVAAAGIALAAAFAYRLGPVKAALAIVLLFGFASYAPGRHEQLLGERTFFGVHRVVREADLMSYYQGTTLHGRQSASPERAGEPLTYFHRTGPLGQLMQTIEPRDVGALGLGVGSVLAYARPSQRWTFFEIDPMVERIARDPRYFTFLARAAAPFEVVIGDGRLSLEAKDGVAYDLLIIDVFSSDAIPVHLLTVEAFDVYWRRLAADGIVAMNLTNRHAALVPVVAAAARSIGLVGLVRTDDEVSAAMAASGKTRSQWVVLANDADRLSRLREDGGWSALPEHDPARAWTDDYANLLGVLWQD